MCSLSVLPRNYDLRGNYIVVLPVPKTTPYCLRSFHHAAEQWNTLSGFVRTQC